MDGLHLDPGNNTANVAGRTFELTPIEFRFMQLLASGELVPYERFVENGLRYAPDTLTDSVRAHICNLRRRFGRAVQIVNRKTKGYRLEWVKRIMVHFFLVDRNERELFDLGTGPRPGLALLIMWLQERGIEVVSDDEAYGLKNDGFKVVAALDR